MLSCDVRSLHLIQQLAYSPLPPSKFATDLQTLSPPLAGNCFSYETGPLLASASLLSASTRYCNVFQRTLISICTSLQLPFTNNPPRPTKPRPAPPSRLRSNCRQSCFKKVNTLLTFSKHIRDINKKITTLAFTSQPTIEMTSNITCSDGPMTSLSPRSLSAGRTTHCDERREDEQTSNDDSALAILRL